MAYSTHSSNYKKPKHQKGEGSKITQLTIIKTERLAHSTWTILIIFPTCNPSIGPWSERSVTISFLQILIQASFKGSHFSRANQSLTHARIHSRPIHSVEIGRRVLTLRLSAEAELYSPEWSDSSVFVSTWNKYK